MTRILCTIFVLAGSVIALLRPPGTEKTSGHWRIDTQAEWTTATAAKVNVSIMADLEYGGRFDLMGKGALLLEKVHSDSLFTRTAAFKSLGHWISSWHEYSTEVTIRSIASDVLAYGNPIDMTYGWKKFENNPVLSGGNTLLPLNPCNISDQTLLLPEPPGGVPQDQSIVRGLGLFEGKWLLFFNQTPDAWPRDYYWSFAVADSLSPLKQGINPFTIPKSHYPLFGPIDNQAPNDWILIDSTYYAPDETYEGMSHLWTSTDLITWTDQGVIREKVGSDPGICFDGRTFHLFSENAHTISHSVLDLDSMQALYNRNVLDVGDHTGDADVSYFNNQWHMFMDDGIHLHYKISYAAAEPDSFPYGWQLYPEIYGPHNPEQGQQWDDDNPKGNDFGTGDADIALEGNTIYLFTERPVGVAYKELTELADLSDQSVRFMIETDHNGDGLPNDSTGWEIMRGGETAAALNRVISGTKFRIRLKLGSRKSDESPLIRYIEMIEEEVAPYRLRLNREKDENL